MYIVIFLFFFHFAIMSDSLLVCHTKSQQNICKNMRGCRAYKYFSKV